ncbi:MAG TPA: hypothetical protein VN914_11730 [Polyangia bacterium]|nr:hypothetical protein [Polyangia bacterium]
MPSHDFGLFDASTGGEVRRFGLGDLARPWKGFTDLWLMADMAMVLSLAVLLGAVIAYHPTSRSKASSLEELEQPKTFIMYAMVGAVIGVVVSIYPVMGPVIFGIGGLLRFRTNVGPAKDTGRVILAVIVGVSAGLKLMVVAVFATACGWLLIWVLERQPFGRLQVRGLVPANIPRSAEAYRKILVGAGCRLVGERKRYTKGLVSFVFVAPSGLDREALEQHIYETVAEDIRGVVDWEVA